jgi:hypothetical protein
MINSYNVFNKLSNESFINTLPLTEKVMEQYNMELAPRFLIFKNINQTKLKAKYDQGIRNKQNEIISQMKNLILTKKKKDSLLNI